MQQSVNTLRPQRDGVTDLYFVGFAGYAYQDVFLKEVRFVKGLFDRRFDTEGRSLALINNLQTHQAIPLASASNLSSALKHIGTIINSNEDVLVLFLTSHGSREHELSVSFWPLKLNQVTPEMLKRYLDEAGIKWRVVFVSACYSGGFIEPLKDPYTLIATAAAPDKQSFGCSNTNDFTYFGEAFFKDQLSFF